MFGRKLNKYIKLERTKSQLFIDTGETSDETAHTTAYSAIPVLVTTTEAIKKTDWDSLERTWKGLQKLPEDEEWKKFWINLAGWVARNDVNHETRPVETWNKLQVAAWARKVLHFSAENANVLIAAEVDGGT